jgi:hypothetical protein
MRDGSGDARRSASSCEVDGNASSSSRSAPNRPPMKSNASSMRTSTASPINARCTSAPTSNVCRDGGPNVTRSPASVSRFGVEQVHGRQTELHATLGPQPAFALDPTELVVIERETGPPRRDRTELTGTDRDESGHARMRQQSRPHGHAHRHHVAEVEGPRREPAARLRGRPVRIGGTTRAGERGDHEHCPDSKRVHGSAAYRPSWTTRPAAASSAQTTEASERLPAVASVERRP